MQEVPSGFQGLQESLTQPQRRWSCGTLGTAVGLLTARGGRGGVTAGGLLDPALPPHSPIPLCPQSEMLAKGVCLSRSFHLQPQHTSTPFLVIFAPSSSTGLWPAIEGRAAIIYQNPNISLGHNFQAFRKSNFCNEQPFARFCSL